MTFPGKLPTETDPLMTQSLRTDFPAGLERQVIDGGVAEGRPEAGDVGGVMWLLIIIFVVLIVAGFIVNWGLFFP